MERTFISLNFTNAVTIFVMAALGWVLFSVGVQILKQMPSFKQGGG